MTHEQAALIRESWPVVAANADGLATKFYEYLFEIDDSAARLFAGVDMAMQRPKLAQALAVVVHGIDDPDRLFPAIAELGKRHARYGVDARHFDSVGEALIAALAEMLGDGFTPELRAAWADAYALIASVMRRAIIRSNAPSLASTGEIAIKEA